MSPEEIISTTGMQTESRVVSALGAVEATGFEDLQT